ncbi:hypothetical protein R1flu_011300 [Riccia fluitans]|uniref:Uncharacterized protein n=1 Tax=Riccia fluitans TaxID=41844 RepID=A0ABD1Z8F2_9MARC
MVTIHVLSWTLTGPYGPVPEPSEGSMCSSVIESNTEMSGAFQLVMLVGCNHGSFYERLSSFYTRYNSGGRLIHRPSMGD